MIFYQDIVLSVGLSEMMYLVYNPGWIVVRDVVEINTLVVQNARYVRFVFHHLLGAGLMPSFLIGSLPLRPIRKGG